MGEITKIDLTWDSRNQEPGSLVLKVPSAIEENRALGILLGAYEGEHNVYTHLAHDLGVSTPRCWYSRSDSATNHFALLIEDLTEHDRIDQADGVDFAAAEACVDALADLHIRWWALDQTAAPSWLPDGYGEALRVYRDLVAGALPAYEESHEELLDDTDRAICHRFVAEFDTLIDRSLKWPLTLLHRDYRIDNILFNNGSPVILDWGNVASGSGLYDLAYFLSTSLTIENRRAWGDGLLARYRHRLSRHGAEYDDFERQHQEAAMFCLIVTILLGGDGLDARDDKGERLAKLGTRRLFTYLRDYDAVAALK
jgi:aminoglycoside/choline kinase family phosphotransferase